jgi:hypothetical protein
LERGFGSRVGELVVPLVAPVALDPQGKGNGEGLKIGLWMENGLWNAGFEKGF